uniref:Uncharacterized protein n=1 Tax=Setaria italica TaxID=4555 RepID=K3YX08_SETIT
MSCDWQNGRCAPCWGSKRGRDWQAGRGAHHELPAASMMHHHPGPVLFLVGGEVASALGQGANKAARLHSEDMPIRPIGFRPGHRSKQSHAWHAVAKLVGICQ